MLQYSEIKEIINALKAGEDINPSDIAIDIYDLRRYAKRFKPRYDNYETCVDCGVFTVEYSDTVKGTVCRNCDENYTVCNHCDDVFPIDDAIYFNDVHWCNSCARRYLYECHECNEYCEDHTTTHDGEILCYSCYEDHYNTCYVCENVFVADEMYYDDDSSDTYCPTCYEEQRKTHVILDYSTKAEHELKWGRAEFRKPHPLYFGMELEVESNGDYNVAEVAEELLYDMERRVILCEDGSLNNGFEIKTPPCSLQELIDIATKVCDSDARSKLRSHDGGNCGLHIHITREALTQLQQGKIYEFVNTERNKKLVKALARRYSTDSSVNDHTNYTRIEYPAKKTHVKRAWLRDIFDQKKIRKNGNVNYTRNTAVNFTSKTLEIRINRGTLKKETLLACIEWVAALVYFTKTGEKHAGKAETTTEFCNWLVHQPDRNTKWKNLTNYLVGKSFLPKTILPKKNPCA